MSIQNPDFLTAASQDFDQKPRKAGKSLAYEDDEHAYQTGYVKAEDGFPGQE